MWIGERVEGSYANERIAKSLTSRASGDHMGSSSSHFRGPPRPAKMTAQRQASPATHADQQSAMKTEARVCDLLG